MRKTLTDGNYFGEIALLFRVKRTATICAVTYSDLSSLLYYDFERIIDENPDFAAAVEEGFAQYIPQSDTQGPLNVANARRSLLTLMDRRQGQGVTEAPVPPSPDALTADAVGNFEKASPQHALTSPDVSPARRNTATSTASGQVRGRRPSIALREALAKRIEESVMRYPASDKDDGQSEAENEHRHEFVRKLYGKIQPGESSGLSGDESNGKRKKATASFEPPSSQPSPSGDLATRVHPFAPFASPPDSGVKATGSEETKNGAHITIAVSDGPDVPTIETSPSLKPAMLAGSRRGILVSPTGGNTKKRTGFGSTGNSWDVDGTGNIVGSTTKHLLALGVPRRGSPSPPPRRSLVGSVTGGIPRRRRRRRSVTREDLGHNSDSDSVGGGAPKPRQRPRRLSLPFHVGASKWIRERQER